MAYGFQLKVQARVFGVPLRGGRGRRIFVQAIFAISLIFIGVSTIFAQDLGALARQEQARKQAEPPHEVHVYTNDDLARPRILVPQDDAKIRNEKVAPEPVVAPEVTVQTKPEVVEASTVKAMQPDPPRTPLGDIARENRELNVARLQQARVESQPVRPSHVYTNEDMARPTILTPEDRQVFEAKQKEQLPSLGQKPDEIQSVEQSHSGPSLGDVARLYRRQPPNPEIKQARRFPLLLGMAAFATPSISRSVTRPPPRLGRALRKVRLRSTARHQVSPGSLAGQTITVMPGDTLWRLARRYLGQGRRWRELQKTNPRIGDPRYLRVGSQIRI